MKPRRKIDLRPPEGAAPSAVAPGAVVPRRAHRSWSKRRVLRWVANLLILGGLLLLAYPISTWGYTWYEQRQLRQQLDQSHPGLAATAAADLASKDMVQVGPTPGAAGTGATSTTTTESGVAGQTPVSQISPAEAERLAQLAAFKAAADEFEKAVGRKTGVPLGRILIPSIGVDKVLIEGTGNGDLREGPGTGPRLPSPARGATS